MPEYALLMYHPVEGGPSTETRGWRGSATPEQMAAERERWNAFFQELMEAGVYVANKGLQGGDAATTVRVRDGETEITDGPFAETKELLAGFFVIEAEDLDTALKYAAKVPSAGYGCVEVRPVWS
jgi:hypothetical protein